MTVVKETTLAPEKPASPARVFWKKFRKQKLAFGAAIFIVLLFIVSLIGPWIAPFDYTKADYAQIMQPPNSKHWLGTDAFGRDILSRIIVGSRITLFVGIASVLAGTIIGTILGLLSGYYGKWVDSLIMRFCDVLLAFPGMLLAIGIIAILGPGMINVVVAVGIFTIPMFARIVRSNTLVYKSALYVEATRSLGAANLYIIFRHILPASFSSIIVYFTMRLGTAILTAASLSFLGLGAQPPSPEWGAMLSAGRDYLTTAPYITYFPGLAIMLTVLAFNLLGDGLRDALDPKVKD